MQAPQPPPPGPPDPSEGPSPVAGVADDASTQAPLPRSAFGVGPSRIPGAGRGLFATRGIAEGTVLLHYTGRVLATRGALRLADKSYLMRLGPQVYVDASNAEDEEEDPALARFVNDCGNPRGHNVRLVKQPEAGRALLVAARDIQEGEELYVDYGKWYWLAARLRGGGGDGAMRRLTDAELVVVGAVR